MPGVNQTHITHVNTHRHTHNLRPPTLPCQQSHLKIVKTCLIKSRRELDLEMEFHGSTRANTLYLCSMRWLRWGCRFWGWRKVEMTVWATADETCWSPMRSISYRQWSGFAHTLLTLWLLHPVLNPPVPLTVEVTW